MQKKLSQKLCFEDTLPETVNLVAGVDVAYVEGLSVGAAVVLDYDTLSLVEVQVAQVETRFPYVPTLLSFREIPPAYLAIRRLHVEPDVFLVDGQGYAHPYGLGFASHLGLILDKPTVGVAKSLLCGNVAEICEGGRVAFLKENDVVIGAEVVTKQGTKPVIVSVGHKVSLERAVRLVLDCARKYRLPEPIRRAHLSAKAEKNRLEKTIL